MSRPAWLHLQCFVWHKELKIGVARRIKLRSRKPLQRPIQPAHLPRHAGQWCPGRHLVVKGWMVRRYEAGCRVDTLSLAREAIQRRSSSPHRLSLTGTRRAEARGVAKVENWDAWRVRGQEAADI